MTGSGGEDGAAVNTRSKEHDQGQDCKGDSERKECLPEFKSALKVVNSGANGREKRDIIKHESERGDVAKYRDNDS